MPEDVTDEAAWFRAFISFLPSVEGPFEMVLLETGKPGYRRWIYLVLENGGEFRAAAAQPHSLTLTGALLRNAQDEGVFGSLHLRKTGLGSGRMRGWAAHFVPDPDEQAQPITCGILNLAYVILDGGPLESPETTFGDVQGAARRRSNMQLRPRRRRFH